MALWRTNLSRHLLSLMLNSKNCFISTYVHNFSSKYCKLSSKELTDLILLFIKIGITIKPNNTMSAKVTPEPIASLAGNFILCNFLMLLTTDLKNVSTIRSFGKIKQTELRTRLRIVIHISSLIKNNLWSNKDGLIITDSSNVMTDNSDRRPH